MSRGRKRQKYSDDFKRDSVNYLISSGKSIAAVSEELGVEFYNLSRWKNQLLGKPDEDNSDMKEDPAAKMRRLEESNKKTEKENSRLRQENEILKKAMGIVSRQ